MITKAQSKYIRSLAFQKFRLLHKSYLVEGDKMCREWLSGNQQIHLIAALPSWIEKNRELLTHHWKSEVVAVSQNDLATISQLQSPNQVLIVSALPAYHEESILKETAIVLDDIQDPGNMGTMLRIADWFGIRHVISSSSSADFFQPKVVQAAMGAHLRVNLQRVNLAPWLSLQALPLCVADMNGQTPPFEDVPKDYLLLIGNEGAGVNPLYFSLAKYRLSIPGKGGADSLNASVSCGIICAMLEGR